MSKAQDLAHKSVVLTLRQELAQERLNKALVEYNLAHRKLDLAQIDVALTRWASEHGATSPGLNGPSFERWLKDVVPVTITQSED